MKNITQLIRECDNLAARHWSLAAGDRGQAARDWLKKTKEAALLIQLLQTRNLKKR